LKKNKELSSEEEKQGKISRRDFLVGAGTVVVGGAIGTGLLSSCKGETVTTTVEKTKTLEKTVTTTIGGESAVTVTKPVGGIDPAFEEENTYVKMIDPMGYGGDMSAVDVKNGKIVRIRPLHYDEVCSEDEIDPAMWEIEVDGKSFKSIRKGSTGYLQSTYKKRVYSRNRILYPLQRVDWEPGGDPEKINPQNRGKSKFKRISWDDATTIIAGEIKRIQDKYGPYAIMPIAEYIHGESKTVHAHGGHHTRLLKATGGYTREVRPTGSVDAWHWGGKHIWGFDATNGTYGTRPSLLDIATNTDMIVAFGGDYETVIGCKNTQPSRARYWLFKEIGIKYINVDPRLNYSAGVWANKWIPIKPNTDAALELAVMYTWIEEGTYDQEYLNTHAVGFDADHMPEGADAASNFKDYVLGTSDGVAKTPEWASAITGIPEWTIKALAREWASKNTSVGLTWAALRTPYCTEYARLQVVMMAMQGLGRPGVHVCNEDLGCGPTAEATPNVLISSRAVGLEDVPQQLPKNVVAEGLLSPPISYYANGSWMSATSAQFKKWEYPIPENEGGTEIHMMWDEGCCHVSCYAAGFQYIDAVRQPTVECYVIQHQWFENDCVLADIVLPVSTSLEESDIVAGSVTTVHAVTGLILSHPVAPKIGEPKSDLEISGEIAKKLESYGGKYSGLYDGYMGGKTIDEWIKYGFENSGVSDKISWEDFEEKGVYLAPVNPGWKEAKSGIINFYNDPDVNPLGTPSGKIEIYSQRLAENFPDDNERPPLPQYVSGGPASEGWTYDESLLGEKCKTYPLLMLDPVRRWGFHSQFSDIPWFNEIPTSKVKGYDGYMYEPVWLHPTTAAEKGIENGDIVKIYNDRGSVLAGAYITERLMPGVIQTEHGCRLDPITDKVDRGGLAQLTSPTKGISKNCRAGCCVNGFLVDAIKLDTAEMEQWRKQNPEAFARDYDPYTGPLFSGWVQEGEL
jgi:trimethylamine-N-oxide reductase (cytochrome c)